MRIVILSLVLLFTTLNAQAKNTSIIIKNSFYADARKQGLSHNTINTITQALSWKINFNVLHKNDKFLIIGSNKKKPDAVFLKHKNKTIRAFLWQNNYYDKNGNGLQSGFLATPLKYSRISSKFQLRRYHPILKTYLPHRALDYAAKYGTKVRAVADGTIKKRQYIGALGNAVFIQHGGGYATLYAHLAKFAKGLRVGKPIKKGQTIGYVGSTGRSTGSHLHYEIRFKGKRKNPLTYKLPKQNHINPTQLADFRDKIKRYENAF